MSSNPASASTASATVLLDLAPSLLEQVTQASYEGTKRALAEHTAQASADCWLNSAQAAELLGYPSLPAFKQARNRNPELAALGIKHGRLWRFRRVDLDAYMTAHPRKQTEVRR